MYTISSRMKAVQDPMIPIVADMISRSPGTISLGQGIVHYNPPKDIMGQTLNDQGEAYLHRYGSVVGRPELHQQVKKKLLNDNAIQVNDNHALVMTAGSNMGFLNTVLAIADPGDEIILLTPYYFNHEMAITIANCKAVLVATDENYLPVLEHIEAAITERTRAIVTISPNNPTGAVYSEDCLTAINRLCKKHTIYHISDEAYEYFIYDGLRHFSPGSIKGSEDHTISLFSLSKSYGMAGWRSAYMLIPKHLLSAVKKLQDTNLICPPIASQLATETALRHGADWISQQTVDFDQCRQLVLDELAECGDKVIVPRPQGAFYVFLRLKEQVDELALVERLINEFKVAVMPGGTFGVEGVSYLRVAYGALEPETVSVAIGRLKQGLKECL